MRIVIEVKRDAVGEVVLVISTPGTQLQVSFGMLYGGAASRPAEDHEPEHHFSVRAPPPWW